MYVITKTFKTSSLANVVICPLKLLINIVCPLKLLINIEKGIKDYYESEIEMI